MATVPGLDNEALTLEFAKLFREHSQFVYRTAYNVTGNRPDAEDVVQNLFLKLLEREFPPDLRRSPKAYLYRAAINASLNTLRARKSRNLADEVELLETPAAPAEPDANDDAHQHLLDAIAHLKPKTVEILILRYTHNYSDAEIAKLLGKSRGTIAVSLYRARARLKKLMRAAQRKDRIHEAR